MTDQLQKKIDRAIRLIRLSAPKDGSPIEVAYSGGKDSDVILQLTKEAGVNYRAIYKNTTIDPPGTIKHAKEMGAEIIMPKKTFFEIIAQKGYPHRTRRFCCADLKEYKVLDKRIEGIRREESVRRAKRYQEPTACRIYDNGDESEIIYPILDWTMDDVREFIYDRHIQCAPVYYDENGQFHPERRLGCIACPLAYKTLRITEFMKRPAFLKAYIKAGRRYLETHPDSVTAKIYANEYEYFYRNLYCEKQSEWDSIVNGLFGKPDFKGYLEKTFNVKLD